MTIPPIQSMETRPARAQGLLQNLAATAAIILIGNTPAFRQQVRTRRSGKNFANTDAISPQGQSLAR